jgi:hypothetical protein
MIFGFPTVAILQCFVYAGLISVVFAGMSETLKLTLLLA